MATCATCGREVGRGLHATLHGDALPFEGVDCEHHELSPHCPVCGLAIAGAGFHGGDHVYCSAACCDEARADAAARRLPVVRRRMFSVRGYEERRLEQGRVGWILLWLLGVPIPVLLVLYLIRGCT
jgi:hypothetical protein